MELHARNRHKSYTLAEEQFIRDNYKKHSDRWISKSIGRGKTGDAIKEKRLTMSLTKQKGKLCNLDTQELPINVSEIFDQIRTLEYYIKVTTHSDVWKDIARTRINQLKLTLKQIDR